MEQRYQSLSVIAVSVTLMAKAWDHLLRMAVAKFKKKPWRIQPEGIILCH
jgi:hypothetical protein